MRPFSDKKRSHVEKVINNLDGVLEQDGSKPENSIFNNDLFFTRRKKEFDLLREHIKANRAAGFKKKFTDKEKRWMENGYNPYSDMAGIEMEMSEPPEIQYDLGVQVPLDGNIQTGSQIRFESLNSENKGEHIRDIVNSYAEYSQPKSKSILELKPIAIQEDSEGCEENPNINPTSFEMKAPMPLEIMLSQVPERRVEHNYTPAIGRSRLNSIRSPKNLNSGFQSMAGSAIEHKDRISVSGVEGLRLITEDPKVLEMIKDAVTPNRNSKFLLNGEVQLQDLSVFASRLNFDMLLKNFSEDGKEFTYHSWNHFAYRRKLLFRSKKKSRKQIVEEDFTDAEKKVKSILDNKNMLYISRDACLRYQYSPEYCFDSILDVMESEGGLLSRIGKELTEFRRPHKMHYTSRIFTYPRDSLYQRGEFPISGSSHGLSRIRTLQRSASSISKASRIRRIHSRVKEDTAYLQSKVCLPIRCSHNPSSLMIKSKISDAPSEVSSPVQAVSGRMNRLQHELQKDNYGVNVISDNYLEDFVEIDTKHLKYTIEPEITIEPEDLYQGILDNESNAETIEMLNWSGEQIYSRSQYRMSKTKTVLHSLNRQEFEIWPRSCIEILRSFQKYFRYIIEKKSVDRFLMACVVVNTLIIVLDRIFGPTADAIIGHMNTAFTMIFLLELVVKLIALGPHIYFKSLMNIFDAAVVVISLIEVAIIISMSSVNKFEALSESRTSALRALRILRMFRVLRVTRILRTMKFMKVIVAVVVETAEQYTYVALTLLIFLFIYSLLGMQIYAGKLIYDGASPRLNFDNFASAFLTLFQLLTMENWTDILEVCYSSRVAKWIGLIYIISWLIVGNYIIFNLFLALLLGGFDSDNVIKSIHERNDEFKEIQDTILRAKLLEKEEQKKLDEAIKKQKIGIGYIIGHKEPDGLLDLDEENFSNSLQLRQRKSKASYIIIRDTKEDESSLEELFYQTIDDRVQTAEREKLLKKQEIDIYQDVYCDVSLFMFTKENKIRRAAAWVVSRRW